MATNSDMQITGYSFGNLIIDEEKYQHDLVIISDQIARKRWWRKEGHILHLADIEEYLNSDIKILLIGRGFSSRLKIDQQLQIYLLQKNIVLQALSTPDACQRYNELDHEKVLACFHLTC